MATADTYVRARIDSDTKARAEVALEAMGLTVSDAIRLLMVRVADGNRLPFAIQAPGPSPEEAVEQFEVSSGRSLTRLRTALREMQPDPDWEQVLARARFRAEALGIQSENDLEEFLEGPRRKRSA